ncbi:MAG: M23 family metallopeptidase [Bacteroidales bacterium]
MNFRMILLFIIPVLIFGCEKSQIKRARLFVINTAENNNSRYFHYDSIFNNRPGFIAESFGLPLGAPDGKGYYISKRFWEPYYSMFHLGEDWSGNGGGDTDFGDTIYSIADGYVDFCSDLQGVWGGVVGIVHKVKNKVIVFADSTIVHDTCRLYRREFRYVKSFYAHCSGFYVQKGQWVKKGQPIAAIGNSGGRFQAHLHLELRTEPGSEIFTGGYADFPYGFINPAKFSRYYNSH